MGSKLSHVKIIVAARQQKSRIEVDGVEIKSCTEVSLRLSAQRSDPAEIMLRIYATAEIEGSAEVTKE